MFDWENHLEQKLVMMMCTKSIIEENEDQWV